MRARHVLRNGQGCAKEQGVQHSLCLLGHHPCEQLTHIITNFTTLPHLMLYFMDEVLTCAA
jgi:hypothetical protein